MRRITCLVLIGLLLITSGCAEERKATHYPVAYVDVKAGSRLNVRRSPAGEWAYLSLRGWEDVVILQQQDNWALVNTPERMQDEEAPLGWVSAAYLHIYRDYIKLEEAQ